MLWSPTVCVRGHQNVITTLLALVHSVIAQPPFTYIRDVFQRRQRDKKFINGSQRSHLDYSVVSPIFRSGE